MFRVYKSALFYLIIFTCLAGAAGAVGPDITTHVLGAKKQILSATTDTMPAGYYAATTLSAVDPDLAAGNIAISTNIFGITGAFTDPGGTAVASDVLAGKTFYTGGAKTGTRAVQVLNAANDTMIAGDYVDTRLSAVDADLAVVNIKQGAVIFGMTGIDPYLPDTGQTSTYGTAADDGDYNSSLIQPSYTLNGDGTTSDNKTGLMWVTDPGAVVYTWANALSSCAVTMNAGLGYAKYRDWRLPNMMEFVSIVNYGNISPAIDAAYFPNTANQYWASTYVNANSGFAWYVNFTTGAGSYTNSGSYRVRCVRGGP